MFYQYPQDDKLWYLILKQNPSKDKSRSEKG